MVQDEFTKRLEALKLDIAAKPVIKVEKIYLTGFCRKETFGENLAET